MLRSCLREVTPSFTKTFRRCHSTVWVLMNSCAPISWFVKPSAASLAIWASCAVNSPPGPGGCARTFSPTATNSRRARSANRSEEHTSELQSQFHLVCRLLLEKKKNKSIYAYQYTDIVTTA